MNNKLLTISIAAYNVQDYIRETLKPFLKVEQADRLEVLIIDDGATDNTYKIAKEYEEQYPNIFKVIHKKNGGWGSTVTTGIKYATGKYFKLLDGDDFFDAKELTSFLNKLEYTDKDMIITPYIKFYDQTNAIEENKNEFYFIDEITEISFEDIPIKSFSLEMYALTFKTELLQAAEIKITENCFYTDNEYVLKCISLCESIVKMPYTIYHYRLARPGQSVSIEGMRKHYKEFEYILRNMLIYVRDNVNNKILQQVFFERYRGLSYYYFEVLIALGEDLEYRQALEKYDKWLKSEFKEIYLGIRYNPLRILRITNYKLYKLAMKFR